MSVSARSRERCFIASLLPQILSAHLLRVLEVESNRELHSSISSPVRGVRPPRLVGESELAGGHLAHRDLVSGLVEPRAERRGHRRAGARTEAAALQRVRRGALRSGSG